MGKKPIKCECTPNTYKCDSNAYYKCESKAINSYNWEVKVKCDDNIYNNKMKCDINYKGCVAAEDITCNSLNKEEFHEYNGEDKTTYYHTDKFRMGPYLVVCDDDTYTIAKDYCINDWAKRGCGDSDNYKDPKTYNICALKDNKLKNKFTYYENTNNKQDKSTECKKNRYCALYNTYTESDGCVSELNEGKYNVAMDKCAIYVRDINERTKWSTLVKWCEAK